MTFISWRGRLTHVLAGASRGEVRVREGNFWSLSCAIIFRYFYNLSNDIFYCKIKMDKISTFQWPLHSIGKSFLFLYLFYWELNYFMFYFFRAMELGDGLGGLVACAYIGFPSWKALLSKMAANSHTMAQPYAKLWWNHKLVHGLEENGFWVSFGSTCS